jgi:hypothetical protein
MAKDATAGTTRVAGPGAWRGQDPGTAEGVRRLGVRAHGRTVGEWSGVRPAGERAAAGHGQPRPLRVGGYFHPHQSPVHASHRAWLSPCTFHDLGVGLWPFDPTNSVAAGERRVFVARGRDYRDVPSLKGIVSGAPSTTAGSRSSSPATPKRARRYRTNKVPSPSASFPRPSGSILVNSR